MTTTTKVLRPKKARTKTREVRRLLPILERLDIEVVSSATLNGAKVTARLSDAIIGLERDLTIDGANVLTVRIFDPERELLRADLLGGQIDLDLGRAGRWRMDRSRDVGGLAVQGDTLTLRLWDVASAALRAQTDPLRVSSARLDLGGFAGVLAREVRNDVRLRVIAPYPGDVPPAETTAVTTTTRTTTRTASSPAGFSSGERLKGHVDDGGRSGYLTSAELRNAATVLQVAADQRAPARATLALVCACMIEGPSFRNSRRVTDGTSVGVLQAQDLHGSVAHRLDIEAMVRKFLREGFWKYGGAIALARKHPTWSAGQIAQNVQGSDFPGRYDRQAAHARKIIAAWKGAPGSSSVSSSTSTKDVARPAQWRRGDAKGRESSWLALDREAKRLGRRRFIALPWLQTPRLVVASDDQLIKAQPHQTLGSLDDGVLAEAPSIELEGTKRLQTVDLTVIKSGWSAPPGACVELTNCGPADGPWIVQRIIDVAGEDTARVTLQQPTTSVEAQQDQTGTATRSRSVAAARRGATSPSRQSPEYEAVYAKAAEISKQNLAYSWGGGHERAGSPSRHPSSSTGGPIVLGYDCSGYVYACLAAAGLGIKPGQPTGNSTTLMSWGRPGKGTEFTIWANHGHTFIQFHGARAGRWADTSRAYSPWKRRKSGPHLRDGTRLTSGFVPRHWPGH